MFDWRVDDTSWKVVLLEYQTITKGRKCVVTYKELLHLLYNQPKLSNFLVWNTNLQENLHFFVLFRILMSAFCI